ncbi:hypothetical protein DPMN_103675 [Dreissena polymorpha]|uniref:Uncharacterized protein n=1 Tax=Dreissena polymorpha TaxID=45954 RepID=A0A9D4H6D4_DREPO|nr:hypothetical protein DPMN_187137 [Dreissena polymorpha]KAH3830431.1 hypothetical protein DPMN_103675 [Dreissena polymorpha]
MHLFYCLGFFLLDPRLGKFFGSWYERSWNPYGWYLPVNVSLYAPLPLPRNLGPSG